MANRTDAERPDESITPNDSIEQGELTNDRDGGTAPDRSARPTSPGAHDARERRGAETGTPSAGRDAPRRQGGA